MSEIPYGYCQCGCGQKTSLYPASRFDKGQIKGEPAKFLAGHNTRVRTGVVRSDHPELGTIKVMSGNYWVYLPSHPNSKSGWVRICYITVTNATGKAIPKGAVVHHADGNSLNDDPSNLVVCQDQSYHRLLHHRSNAYKATGNANARRCAYCGEWEVPPYHGMYIQPWSQRRQFRAYHYKCRDKSDYDSGRR